MTMIVGSSPNVYPVSDATYARLKAIGWATWFASRGKKSACRRAKVMAVRRNRAANFTRTDLQKAVVFFEGLCPVCNCRLVNIHRNDSRRCSSNQVTVDHWQPLAFGGDGTAGNCIPLCWSCNDDKHDQEPLTWLVGRFGPSRGREKNNRVVSYLRMAARR